MCEYSDYLEWLEDNVAFRCGECEVLASRSELEEYGGLCADCIDQPVAEDREKST